MRYYTRLSCSARYFRRLSLLLLNILPLPLGQNSGFFDFIGWRSVLIGLVVRPEAQNWKVEVTFGRWERKN